MLKSHHDSSFIILGAGYGGLATAALLSQKGYQVTVLEAHKELGGCASIFSRHGFTYDVGATTLSGLSPGGPLREFLNSLNLDLNSEQVDPGIWVLGKNNGLAKYRNFENWMGELNDSFPSKGHQEFWEKIEKIEQKSWNFLKSVRTYPPQNLNHFLRLTFGLGKGIELAPYLFKTTFESLPSDLKDNKEFIQLIDNLLLISTQGVSREVPFLAGAMGLNYLNDVHYSFGGMNQLAEILRDYIEDNGGKVLTDKKIIDIEKSGERFLITTSKGDHFTGKTVISNIPFWNLENLVSIPRLKKFFGKRVQKFEKTWGAFSAYLPVELREQPRSLYVQASQNDLPSWLKGSFFYSFSHPHDNLRAPVGTQTVSISLHCDLNTFPYKTRDNGYSQMKEELELMFQERFLQDFKSLGAKVLMKPIVGTPHSFERFTGRLHGQVGGFAHTIKNPPWKFPTSDTPDSNFFLIGDTTFPGQGVVGVISGAQGLVERLTS